jgi:stage III sporulation protein AE
MLFLGISNYALAAPLSLDEIENDLYGKLSTENINQFITRVNADMNENLPPLTFDKIKELATGGITMNWDEMKGALWARFVYELTGNAYLMGKLLLLAVLCSVLQNLQNSFESSRIAMLAYGLCFIFMAVIALTAFQQAITTVKDTVNQMVDFMEALLPLLMSMLAGVGALTSAALLTPLMLFVISSTSLVTQNIVLPLLLLTAVLECLNYFTDYYQVSNLSGLLKQAGIVVMGFTLMLFIGIITIQGAAGSVADGLTLRTAKFATTTFIPVVGKTFADTVELIMGASLMMKNAIGLFGLIVVSMICVFPLIKLSTLIIIIKFTGALIQPMGDIKMAKFLNCMGNNLLLVFGAVLTVALMFFLAITMIVASGSAAMMLR